MGKKLNCPECHEELKKSEKLSTFFGLDVYECRECEDWGVLINGKLDWNFSTKEEKGE